MDEALQMKEVIEMDIKNMAHELIGKISRSNELKDKFEKARKAGSKSDIERCEGALEDQRIEILIVTTKMSKAKDYLNFINEILDRGYKEFKQQEELEREIPIPVQYC
nr:hypothetical protein [Clostridioides sp.]